MVLCLLDWMTNDAYFYSIIVMLVESKGDLILNNNNNFKEIDCKFI
jgi:hypothetical protein